MGPRGPLRHACVCGVCAFVCAATSSGWGAVSKNVVVGESKSSRDCVTVIVWVGIDQGHRGLV
eukprot:m.118894 g.118894  ORF g.118894 m.118894 type:complete len:63 (+) comp21762_c0_seq1:518-706(+)